MIRRHLSDDQLTEACLALAEDPAVSRHLASCDACRLRQAGIVRLLEATTTAAVAEADDLFPDAWLTRQRARILARVDHLGRPARVIAFPASARRETVVRHARPAARLVAAGAAAGLAIGLLTGRLVSRPPERPQTVATQVSAKAQTGPTVRTVSAVGSDDEFFGQVEMAGGSGGPAALRPLDALTPRAWDVR